MFGTLYDKSIENVSVLHDADNLSDHEPIILKLISDVHYVGFVEKNSYTSYFMGQSY